MSTKDNDKKKEEAPIMANTVPVGIVPEMKRSYLDYAMSVIVSRALPDVRDGLKPVHRRILFSMHELGLSYQAKFKKSVGVVGEVLKNYHPHGDSSVYDAMVKLAQDFSTRYPLVAGQGNFGSIDGDSAAAYRYTEAKMARIAAELLRDIDKETVEWRPNFDNTRKEPVVLPSVLPNLLLNGTLGIAVGMATKIPPHNLGEVVNALIHLVDNPEATTEDLLQFVKGPDFPTGGVVYGEKDIQHAYASGRGGVVVRGEAEIIETKAGAYHIVISSIPYQVNKAELIIKMADLVHEKKLDGIRDIRDESTRDIRVVIELKSGAQPQKVLNALYKHTELESTFHYNMLALVNGVPELLSLSRMLGEFVGHRKEVVTRRTQFDLARALEREHILLGLKKALDHIDAVIRTIRKSKDVVEAEKNLIKEFDFTEIQAKAILDMRLQRLANLERQKVEDELKEKQKLIKDLRAILADPKRVLSIIKGEFTEVAERHGDERRTRLSRSGVKSLSDEDLIPDVESVLVLSRGGYIKRTDPKEYRVQRRGGVGVMDLDTKEEDFVSIFLSAFTHNDLLFFTDRGKVYQIKMYEIPEGKRATRGKSIMNYISLAEGERVTSILPVPKNARSTNLVMATKAGTVKRVKADSFKDVRRSGIIALRLDAGDELLSATLLEKDDDVVLVSAKGQSIRFKGALVREMGRTAGGVRGIKLGKGDVVVGMAVVSKEKASQLSLLVMSEHGYGKRTLLKEYKAQGRGGSGIKTAQVTAKTGSVMAACVVGEEELEVLAISKQGQTIRVSLDEVPSLGRQTQGVRIMKMRESDSLASLVCL